MFGLFSMLMVGMAVSFSTKKAKVERGGRALKNYSLEVINAIRDHWADSPLEIARLDANPVSGDTFTTSKKADTVRTAVKNALMTKYGFQYIDPDDAKAKKSGIATAIEAGDTAGTYVVALWLTDEYLLLQGTASAEELLQRDMGELEAQAEVPEETEPETEPEQEAPVENAA